MVVVRKCEVHRLRVQPVDQEADGSGGCVLSYGQYVSVLRDIQG